MGLNIQPCDFNIRSLYGLNKHTYAFTFLITLCDLVIEDDFDPTSCLRNYVVCLVFWKWKCLWNLKSKMFQLSYLNIKVVGKMWYNVTQMLLLVFILKVLRDDKLRCSGQHRHSNSTVQIRKLLPWHWCLANTGH